MKTTWIFVVTMTLVMWSQITYGATLIQGVDAQNVVVTTTAWTELIQTTMTGGNSTQYQLSEQVLTTSTETAYSTDSQAWAVNTEYSLTATYNANADLQFTVGGVSPVSVQFPSHSYVQGIVGGVNLLKITITTKTVLGGGIGLLNLRVNGSSDLGSWSLTAPIGNHNQELTFFVDLQGQSFSSISGYVEFYPMDDGVAVPDGQQVQLSISGVVGVVPEPSILSLLLVCGIGLLAYKFRTPQRSC